MTRVGASRDGYALGIDPIGGVNVRKVTVVGAGKYGSTTAEKIARMDLVDQVVLTDIVEGLPQGLALDMNQARPVEKYRTLVVGTNDYADTAGSDVVVITAGSPRKPGMSRMDLLTVNAKVVKGVTEEANERRLKCAVNTDGSGPSLRYWIVGGWRRGMSYPVAFGKENWRREVALLAKRINLELCVAISSD